MQPTAVVISLCRNMQLLTAEELLCASTKVTANFPTYPRPSPPLCFCPNLAPSPNPISALPALPVLVNFTLPFPYPALTLPLATQPLLSKGLPTALPRFQMTSFAGHPSLFRPVLPWLCAVPALPFLWFSCRCGGCCVFFEARLCSSGCLYTGKRPKPHW